MAALLTGGVWARAADEILQAPIEALELDYREQAAGEYGFSIDWSQGADLDGGLQDVLDTGLQSVQGVVGKALRSALLLLAIVLLSGLADGAAIWGGKGGQAAQAGAALAVAAVAAADSAALISLGSQVIEEMEVFGDALLPTAAAATAAAGAPGAAAARQLASVLFSDLLTGAIRRLLLPLVYAFIALSTAYAALGNEGLNRVAAALRWVTVSVLTALLLAFVAYLTISGVIAGATDATTLKAAKFAVSTAVPVVGGILSDAAGTVLAGAGILKNSIGVFGMLAVLSMSVLPFVHLGAYYLIYKLTAALAAAVAPPRIAGLIDSIGKAFALVLGMVGSCALLLLVSMVAAVTVAGA
ncbi:MAG: stage III sporulation protein AE [Oscillospiraceae bacterium]|nr:stage III sporulation protein AE [Oscillospiraceae bacterium]